MSPRKAGASSPGAGRSSSSALAVLNEIVWRTQTTDLWVKFKTFGFLPLTLLFAVAQAPLIMQYETKDEDTVDNDF